MTGAKKREAPRFGVTIPEVIDVSGHFEGGAIPMIVTIPPRLKCFCERFVGDLTEKRREALAWLLAGMLLVRGRRSQSGLARAVLERTRSPSSVSRRMRRDSFRTREMVRAEMKRRVSRELWRAKGTEEVWFLLIDGVASKRGGRTKVPNAMKYREKGRGEEDTASHRRNVSHGVGEKGRRAYRYCCERRAVAGIGEAAVVYSWKRRRDRSGRLTDRETFKALVCSEPELLGERNLEKVGALIVEFFEMRWEVEVFFRELKSDLGFSDYQGCDFRAFERHVDLVLLSLMFLEDMRREEMARTRSPVKRREAARMRTRGLKARLAREAFAADLEWITELAGSREGCSQTRDLLPELKIPA